ncbi:hypothetical protein IMCC1989_1600 [gamma proteobacterium IMCC1989]|nr:hypothetical protein IMCC1989_1600 [gamma proteobacterium IMCC1989]
MLSSSHMASFMGGIVRFMVSTISTIKKHVNPLVYPVLLLTLSWFSTGISVANAEKQVDLYTHTQLVLDQSENLRLQAMRAGLASVFVRVTGDAQSVKQAAVVQALSKPSAYVSQYRYRTTDEVITIAGASRPAQELWLQFSESAIQRVLQTAQLPVWPNVRPEILLWVAADESGKRILGSGSTPINAFKRTADIRGLPLAMPLLDLTDRQELTATRLWARDERAINRASARYGADGVLAGRIVSVSAVQLRGNFVLIYNGRSYGVDVDGDNATVVVQKVMDQVVSVLAKANAVVVSSDGALASHIAIGVDNVFDFSAYAELLESLRNLSTVSHVMLKKVNHSHLLIDLRYQGDYTRLRQQLSSLPILQSIPVEQFVEKYPPVVEPVKDEAIDTVPLDTSKELTKELNSEIDDVVDAILDESVAAPRLVPRVVPRAVPVIDAAFTWSGSEPR